VRRLDTSHKLTSGQRESISTVWAFLVKLMRQLPGAISRTRSVNNFSPWLPRSRLPSQAVESENSSIELT